MDKHRLPNQLTALRVVLAVVFMGLLNVYRYPSGPGWTLGLAAAVFVLAAITDWLDGYLARKWEVTSAFGRVMDPFADKVIVLGGLIHLAGPRFLDPAVESKGAWMCQASGVYPWMVALILIRELLVTGIRAEMERQGVQFGAKLWGKLKTVVQMGAIPIIILALTLAPQAAIPGGWVSWLNHTLAILMVVTTLFSSVPYVKQAVSWMSRDDAGES